MSIFKKCNNKTADLGIAVFESVLFEANFPDVLVTHK